MAALELAGQLLEAVEGPGVVALGPGLAKAPAHAGPVALGQVIEDVALLVADAALHPRPITRHGRRQITQSTKSKRRHSRTSWTSITRV